ncbi:hypothetical protein [Nakamurella deserti]|uniref:hypothetical protein n=1 Tax=Nakamurella deserti TaxID=2164074 RepID=UPI000DBE6F03|nr:hypothetical protein [Nakamurella deserti]
MSDLSARINAASADLFGPLTPETPAARLGSAMPVLATPAGVAAGVATAAAFVAGYAVEEAGDK